MSEKELKSGESGSEQVVIDQKLVQDLAKSLIKAFNLIHKTPGVVSEQKLTMWAPYEAELEKAVRQVLFEKYKTKKITQEIEELGRFFSDAVERSIPADGDYSNFTENLASIQSEVDAKTFEFKAKNKYEINDIVPPNFDQECNATVAEIIRVLFQTLESIN